MKANMGILDRGARILVAILLFILFKGGIISGVWAVLFLIIAGIFTLTSLVGICPLYIPLGIKTLESRKGLYSRNRMQSRRRKRKIR